MNRPLAIFAGGVGTTCGLWLILRTVFATMPDDGKVIFLLGLVCSYAAGACTVLVIARAIGTHAYPRREPDIVDGNYQEQPRPQLQRIAPGHWQAAPDPVQLNADRIYSLMYPQHLPLTRASIIRATGIQSHVDIAAALDELEARGVVERGKIGRESRWRNEEL